jgi:transcriptional regulator with XRE-family HTH domain
MLNFSKKPTCNFLYGHKSSIFELLILKTMINKPHLKIKQIRELKNLTQDSVAAKLNLSTRAYSKIETGETQLTINRLNEISAIFEIDPMEILGFDDKQVFNSFKQDGYIGINHINLPEKLVLQYEETIQALKEQIQLLKLLQDK